MSEILPAEKPEKILVSENLKVQVLNAFKPFEVSDEILEKISSNTFGFLNTLNDTVFVFCNADKKLSFISRETVKKLVQASDSEQNSHQVGGADLLEVVQRSLGEAEQTSLAGRGMTEIIDEILAPKIEEALELSDFTGEIQKIKQELGEALTKFFEKQKEFEPSGSPAYSHSPHFEIRENPSGSISIKTSDPEIYKFILFLLEGNLKSDFLKNIPANKLPLTFFVENEYLDFDGGALNRMIAETKSLTNQATSISDREKQQEDLRSLRRPLETVFQKQSKKIILEVPS